MDLNGGIPCRLFGSHEVGGISHTHGFLEAIIVVGDVDQAALKCRKISEPVRGNNGSTKKYLIKL